MAKFTYRDATNWKDQVELPIPKSLEGKFQIGDDIDVTFLGYDSAENFIETYFDRNFSHDYDHGLLELDAFDETDFKDRLETVGGITLNLDYWDCGCDKNYIHPNEDKVCSLCGAESEDMPNSMQDEVLNPDNHKIPSQNYFETFANIFKP